MFVSSQCPDELWARPVAYWKATGLLSPTVKRSELELDQLPSSAEVKNEWSFTSFPLCPLMPWVETFCTSPTCRTAVQFQFTLQYSVCVCVCVCDECCGWNCKLRAVFSFAWWMILNTKHVRWRNRRLGLCFERNSNGELRHNVHTKGDKQEKDKIRHNAVKFSWLASDR